MNWATTRFAVFGASLAILLCVLLAMPSASLATPVTLLPGASLQPAPTGPVPSGTILATATIPFAAPPLYSGTLTSTVLSGDPTNSLGGLTFTYSIHNDGSSTDAIDRLTINNYTGVTVNAAYDPPPPPGLAPNLINRSISGGTVGFTFDSSSGGPGELLPGDDSTLLVLRTDSHAFAPTFASVINGTVTSVSSFAPTAVPEPSSLTLLALGIVAGALRLRRR